MIKNVRGRRKTRRSGVSSTKLKKRSRGKPASRGSIDTMLRLNIRCLNNQARFDPRRLLRGDEREKDRERKNEGGREKTSVQTCARARGTRRNESCVEDKLRKKRERKRRRRRFRFRLSGNRTRSPPFLVFRARSSSLPFPPPIRSPPRLPLTLRRTSRRSLFGVSSLSPFLR